MPNHNLIGSCHLIEPQPRTKKGIPFSGFFITPAIAYSETYKYVHRIYHLPRMKERPANHSRKLKKIDERCSDLYVVLIIFEDGKEHREWLRLTIEPNRSKYIDRFLPSLITRCSFFTTHGGVHRSLGHYYVSTYMHNTYLRSSFCRTVISVAKLASSFTINCITWRTRRILLF